MLQGKATLVLHDVETGREEKIVEHNMVTNAIHDLLTVNPAGICSLGSLNSMMTVLPLCPNAIGGVILFPDKLEEDASKYYADPSNIPTGYASNDSYNGINQHRGSYNLTESGKTDDGYRLVFDFSTNQGNGRISAIALTSAAGGVSYFGNEYVDNDTPWFSGTLQSGGDYEYERTERDPLVFDGTHAFAGWNDTDYGTGESYSNILEYGKQPSSTPIHMLGWDYPLKRLHIWSRTDMPLHSGSWEQSLSGNWFLYWYTYAKDGVSLYYSTDAERRAQGFCAGDRGSFANGQYYCRMVQGVGQCHDGTAFYVFRDGQTNNLGNQTGNATIYFAQMDYGGKVSQWHETYAAQLMSLNAGSIISGGHLYCWAYDGKGIYRLGISDPTDVTLIQLKDGMQTKIAGYRDDFSAPFGDGRLYVSYHYDGSNTRPAMVCNKDIMPVYRSASGVNNYGAVVGPYYINRYFGSNSSHPDYSHQNLRVVTPYLATINNLGTPVTKTVTQTLKVIYDLTEKE